MTGCVAPIQDPREPRGTPGTGNEPWEGQLNVGPSDAVHGAAGVGGHASRARGCARPIRLIGSCQSVSTATGEITTVCSSEQLLDGLYAVGRAARET